MRATTNIPRYRDVWGFTAILSYTAHAATSAPTITLTGPGLGKRTKPVGDKVCRGDLRSGAALTEVDVLGVEIIALQA